MDNTKPKHGGARPGSGRKSKGEMKKVQMSATVRPETRDAIKTFCKENDTRLGVILDKMVADGTLATDYNTKRNRCYGVRLGDIVSYDVPGFPKEDKTYIVVHYGFMDNNRVYLQDGEGNIKKAVAEWCRIVKKVEDNRP
jgi:hypothetical protein